MNNIFENIDTICFTGPRPAKLYGYTKKEEYQKIVDQLKEVIRGLQNLGLKIISQAELRDLISWHFGQ